MAVQRAIDNTSRQDARQVGLGPGSLPWMVNKVALTAGIRSVTNPVTKKPIDYYEIDILPFQKQIYPGKRAASMVGYDGISPGPTFIIEKGRETVVRFTNKARNDSSIHLHGSYSVRP